MLGSKSSATVTLVAARLPSLRVSTLYWIVSPGDGCPLPSASTTSTSFLVATRIGVALTGVRVGSSSCAVSGSSDGVVGALVEVTKPWVESWVTSALSGPLIVARNVIVVFDTPPGIVPG